MKGPPAAGQRTVSVLDDRVIKTQTPEASRKERLRTLAGREVGQQTGRFLVPDIVAFDDGRGEIVFERLRLCPLLRATTAQSRELVVRAARALAAIHQHLTVAEGAGEVPADGGKLGPAPDHALIERNRVPLHGDFGLSNVLFHPDSDRLALIDWANAAWLDVDADCGPPEIDLAVFLTSLFHRRAFASRLRRHELAFHFLTTYAEISPYGIDLDALRSVMAATTPRFKGFIRQRKGTLRALGYRHSMIDLALFLRRLPTRSFIGDVRPTTLHPNG